MTSLTDCSARLPVADRLCLSLSVSRLLPAMMVFTVLMLCLSQARALPEIDGREAIPVPTDFSRVSFYLITVDVGNNVWDNFGHTALRVVDEDSDTDLMFNWGLFDTSVGLLRFSGNFLRGVMPYELGVAPSDWELARYEREQRTVWQDRINLTETQKRRLYERLAWNLRAENIVYDYDYFFDNCTTRVRDYLDEAMGGGIQAAHRSFVPRTFRDEVRHHYASLPVISLSLDVLMNARIDQRMTQWQQMFLPLSLRDQLRRMPSQVLDANGRSRNLLDESAVLISFEPPAALPNPYHLAGGLALPLLFLLLMLRRVSLSNFGAEPGFTLRAPALSYRVLGVVGLLLALFSGVYGCMMLLGWLFSGHLDLHQNINLLLFWPTDILAVVFGLHWLLSGGAYRLRAGAHQLVILYLMAHVLFAMIHVLLGVTGLVGQRVGEIQLYLLPVLLLFSLLLLSAGLRATRRLRF